MTCEARRHQASVHHPKARGGETGRWWVRVRLAWATAAALLAGALVFAALPASAVDFKAMSPTDLRALQERLRDAQCYTGAIDGSAGAATEAALKRCPVMDPILTIETGMHTAMINRIGVDRDCRLLATGSDDKTVPRQRGQSQRGCGLARRRTDCGRRLGCCSVDWATTRPLSVRCRERGLEGACGRVR
jgi:hypothetical protein